MTRDASTAWRKDHPWAKFYDWMTDHDAVGQALWRVGMGSDLKLLHRTAAAEFGRLSDGQRVLDIPCGGGIALDDLPADLNLDYVAADISPAMLERTQQNARALGVTVSTTEEDVQALTFDDGSFDLVLTFTSLHCFPDPKQAVAELCRVVAPGGRLVGSAMFRGGPVWHRATWVGGTALGVLGPGCTRTELHGWLTAGNLTDVSFRQSGAITYFTASKAG